MRGRLRGVLALLLLTRVWIRLGELICHLHFRLLRRLRGILGPHRIRAVVLRLLLVLVLRVVKLLGWRMRLAELVS